MELCAAQFGSLRQAVFVLAILVVVALSYASHLLSKMTEMRNRQERNEERRKTEEALRPASYTLKSLPPVDYFVEGSKIIYEGRTYIAQRGNWFVFRRFPTD